MTKLEIINLGEEHPMIFIIGWKGKREMIAPGWTEIIIVLFGKGWDQQWVKKKLVNTSLADYYYL